MHASIDLETLGNTTNAAITQIGVSLFELETGEIHSQTNILVGWRGEGHVNASTLAWWFRQGDEARARMAESLEHPNTLAEALIQLRCLTDWSNIEGVWGNGSTFDVTILDSAYQRGGGESPWPFYAARDMRTIVDLAERLRGFDKKSVERIGVHHEAADDAAHQARVISAAYATLKG
ncbi:MAG: 3'-5' exonuclease [Comamonas sp.]|uniref:3'-5' exonuclease n=1 Tax=Comamonas sp. TaxID=34028 RepID=UPI002FC8711E